MTVEEQLAKAQEDIKNLTKQVKDQNSYITKLEGENKTLKNAPAPTKPKVSNPAYDAYQKKKWRTDVINDAFISLRSRYGVGKAEAMRSEVNAYCEKHMQETNTTEIYVISVFEMLFGRAMGNPNHEIHKLAPQPNPVPKVEPKDEPATPQPNPLHETLTPHVMSPNDQPAVPGNVPPAQPKEYKSVKDSFAALKNRIAGANENSQ